MRRAVWAALLTSISAPAAPPPRADTATYQKTVLPFLERNCLGCHTAKLKSGGLDLERFRSPKAAIAERDTWENALRKLRTGEMPPKPLPRPPADQVAAVTAWMERQVEQLDARAAPEPGRVTARRLNRAEYNNTVRDLLGVDLRPADDFPADDSGYGFDNIGDVLTVPPVLMEKYLAAAEKLARAVVVIDTPLKPVRERILAERLKQSGSLRFPHRFPAGGEYSIRVGLAGRRPNDGDPVRLGVFLDGKLVKTFDAQLPPERPRVFEFRAPVDYGERTVGAALLDAEDKPDSRDRGVLTEYVEITGPYNQRPRPLTEAHKRLFVCGHANGQHAPGCARLILSPLARRAWRRPVSEAEVSGLVRFVDMAAREGEPFEQGVALAVQAVLVSPHFLFRIEKNAKPGIHPITGIELASRLSYFLWSSMPGDALLGLGEKGLLRKPGVLEGEVRRMLADAKSGALVDNFGGQWLQLRNLDSAAPDPDRFPAFDRELRDAMAQETRLFFEGVVREDRSILEFLTARYTYLNERLARHYGIPGVSGKEFRKVELDGEQRGGILTHASVLTVSSYPTRTSPVLRGKWVLENLLNAPPPPPPPDVPNLDEEAVGATGTLRRQMEKHRSNPVCSSCHTRMDALGFGLENYDAIGAWRTRDGKFPIDAAGALPNGRAFSTPRELREILAEDREAFTRAVTEKLLTYALGRGLENHDKPAINSISRRVAAGGYQFSRLVLEIVSSPQFQMRRGEGPVNKPAAAGNKQRGKRG